MLLKLCGCFGACRLLWTHVTPPRCIHIQMWDLRTDALLWACALSWAITDTIVNNTYFKQKKTDCSSRQNPPRENATIGNSYDISQVQVALISVGATFHATSSHFHIIYITSSNFSNLCHLKLALKWIHGASTFFNHELHFCQQKNGSYSWVLKSNLLNRLIFSLKLALSWVWYRSCAQLSLNL